MAASKFGPKRFVAGAVCPKCAEQDKTVLYRVSDTEQVRECVRCGHLDRLKDDAPGGVEEPGTRVNKPRLGEQALQHEDELMPVTIVDPGKRRDH